MKSYEMGKNLYAAFVKCVEGAQDREKLRRLQNRLDTYQSGLTGPQNAEFLAILVSSGLIPAESELGKAITLFGGQKLRVGI